MVIQTKLKQPHASEVKKTELKFSELLLILLVAGLGFFVDVYDLAIFCSSESN